VTLTSPTTLPLYFFGTVIVDSTGTDFVAAAPLGIPALTVAVAAKGFSFAFFLAPVAATGAITTAAQSTSAPSTPWTLLP